MQFNSKVNIVRTTVKRDTVGGFTENVETTIHTDLPCRINWSRAREKVMFGKDDYLRDAKLYCRAVDITVADVVVYNDDNYNIVGLVNVDNRNRQMVLDIIKVAK